VADDHDLVREAIAAFLLAEGMAAVSICADLAECAAALHAAPHDLALVDFGLPGLEGMAGFARFVQEVAPTPVALLSGSTSRELAEAALDAGGRGFVPKKMPARAMVAAVRLMARGEKFAPMGLLKSELTPGAPLAMLTPREMSVLKGICAGKSNKEIARDLELQEVTVKLHVKTLSRKLGARNRTHAAMIGRDGWMV
jgi:DNA-binding NarL/FixJ family response regulator